MIDRAKVLKGLQCCQNIDVICMDISCYEPEFTECPYHGLEENCVSSLCADALKLLQNEIVTCKECKYGSEPVTPYKQGSEKWCYKQERHRPYDFYCADGERK